MPIHVLIWPFILILLSLVTIGCSTTPSLSPVEKGQEAYSAGNHEQAIVIWEEIANSDDKKSARDANFKLGYHYHDSDSTKAIGYYKRSASLGSRVAMYNMGQIHSNNDDAPQFFHWMTQSADLGYQKAMNRLAYVYKVNKEYSDSVHWLIKLHESGYKNDKFPVISDLRDIAKLREWGSQDARNYLKKIAGEGNQEAMIAMAEAKRSKIEKFYWYQKAYETGKKYRVKALTEMKSIDRAKTDLVVQQLEAKMQLAAETKKKQEQLAELKKIQREREEAIQSARRAEDRREAELEREKRRQGQADAIALLSSIYATHKGDTGLANAAADLSRDKGSGKYNQQLSDSARQTSEYDRQKLEAQQERERQASVRKEAQLRKELAALEREQKQQADLQQIKAAVQRKQSTDKQATLQSTQQAQRDAAEKQRIQTEQRQKIKAQAIARQERLERLRKQGLAQASQRTQTTASTRPQVSYQNCVSGAESSPRVRDKSVGSEAYVKNFCEGPIRYVLCVRDNTTGLNINSPTETGSLNPDQDRWANIALLKASEIDAGFGWCGPAGNCDLPKCR